MKLLSYLPFIVAALAAAVPSADALPNGLSFRSEAPGNYSIAEIEWRGMPDFDKDRVFTGTIENVIDQMRTIKGPDYKPEFMIDSDATNHGPAGKRNSHAESGDHYVTCGGPDASAGRIQQGINYLSNLPDSVMCSMPPGPKNCGRISCSWKSGIWWCNEKPTTSDLYQCNIFALYAAEILESCAIDDDNPRVAGYNWDSGFNFTVQVKEAWC
ncbi:hypothetical protein F4861DRAFT_187335 [Xylaria intraflava]|nr:hypothetical protein F4861DRAFT_187335 [Xylaria intraflava]